MRPFRATTRPSRSYGYRHLRRRRAIWPCGVRRRLFITSISTTGCREKFAIVGVDPQGDGRRRIPQAPSAPAWTSSRARGKTADKEWAAFAEHLNFHAADFGDAAAFTALAGRLVLLSTRVGGTTANHLFYLSTPPSLKPASSPSSFPRRDLAQDRTHARIVAEKPFGSDLASAKKLNQELTSAFEESQIYRIDHYLGKETVQNILAFRFANASLSLSGTGATWITCRSPWPRQWGWSTEGILRRAGALRDMVQNHLMQLLCLMAMEPPISFEADEIRNKKVDVLHAIRPIPQEGVTNRGARPVRGGLARRQAGARIPRGAEEWLPIQRPKRLLPR